MPEGQQDQRAESARLVPGVRLLGEYQGSGFVEPRYLVARSDGQLLHVSRLLFLVASALREGASPTSAAQQVSAAYGRTLTPDGLVLLVEHKLQPMGLARVERPAPPGAAVPPAPGPSRAPALPPTSLLTLRFRRVLVSQDATRVVAALLAPLFHPAVVVALLGSLLAADTWLVRSASLGTAVADTLRTPPVMLLLLAILLVSTLFHEFGHAAACRYGGATPGAIGVALYVVYPAFYTDVTQSYRLGRAGRVRTDLGGVYFNAISALALTALYAQTAYAPLLLAIALVHLELAQQLLPLARLDGYFIVADLIGVPDLFSRVGPILSSLVPGRVASPRVRELRPAARAVVTIWVLTAVPVMVGLLAVLVWRVPNTARTIWASEVVQWHGLVAALSTVDPPARAAGAAVPRAAPAPAGGPRPPAGRDRATRPARGHPSGRASFPLTSGPPGSGPTLTGGHDVRTIISTPAGPGVHEDEVVVAVEEVDGRAVVLLAERLADPRVVVRGHHLEPRVGGLRGVAPHVGIPLDAVALFEQVGDRAAGLPAHPVRQAAGIGVGVEGDHPVAAVAGEGVPEHERRRGLAGAALAGDDHDAP